MKMNFNYLSFIGAVMAFTGNIFVTTISYQLYGFYIFLASNVILAWVNRKDMSQVGLYIGYQLLAIYGIAVRI